MSEIKFLKVYTTRIFNKILRYIEISDLQRTSVANRFMASDTKKIGSRTKSFLHICDV